MPKKNDSRPRDLEGEIRRKNETTKVETLRKTYGENFARGYPGKQSITSAFQASSVKRSAYPAMQHLIPAIAVALH